MLSITHLQRYAKRYNMSSGSSDDWSEQFSDIDFSDNFIPPFRNGNYTNCSENYNSNVLNGNTDIHHDVSGPYRVPKRRGRPIGNNAARERSRVKTLRTAFLDLQRTLPAVPPDTKLSKLDVLVLATTYIAHLMSALHDDGDISHIFAANGCMHPVKVSSRQTVVW